MNNDFPIQKLPSNQKTHEWAEKCAKAALEMFSMDNPKIRQSYVNKLTNYNLANDVLDQKDVERVCNPYKIKGVSFPAKMQNYPVALPKIDLLVGEEAKRQFDWKFVVTNRDAINEKDAQKSSILKAFIEEEIRAEQEPNQQELAKRLQAKVDYISYDFQDIREKKANMIMKYYWTKEDFAKKFNDGFMDALIGGEENYCVDIEGNQPVLRKVNPLNVRAYRSGESPWLQDSDIIVEEGYYSLGNVVDRFYDELTPTQLKNLENRTLGKESDGSIINVRQNEPQVIPDGVFMFEDGSMGDPYSEVGARLGTSFDNEGNILVSRVVWKSFRKVGVLTFFDEETGDIQKTIVDEKYKPNIDKGEEIQWHWVGEWWETTVLGAGREAIYIKSKRRPSYRGIGNISKSHSGYIGLAYNISGNKAMSLLDRMRPYQYLYNVLMYRTELAFAKSHGKIMRLPLHEIPHGWSMDKYLSFAFGYNIAVYDAFKEGNKGASLGKLAGNMQQNRHEIDLEMGSYIQQHIDMMLYIKEELGEISGVSKARQGQIHNRSAVGNVNREVTQSSHITEKWFKAHDLVKKMVMEVFLDTAIYTLEKNPLQSQVVVGDFMTETFQAFPEEFQQVTLGIMISDSSDDYELIQTLKQMTAQMVQAEQIGFGELASIFTTKSISDMTRKIENAQKRRDEREERMNSEKVESDQQIAQQALQWEKDKLEAELNMDKYEVDMKFLIEQQKIANSGVDASRIITLETLRQNAQKIEDALWKAQEEIGIKKEQLEETKRKNRKDEELKQKQINKPTSKK